MLHGVDIGAIWRIRLKSPCAAAMRPIYQITWSTCLTNIWSSLIASSIVPVFLICTKVVDDWVFAPFQTGGAYGVPQSYKTPAVSKGTSR